jgi:Arc/MetJ-type ribon-helix-helix transcriptional regulator
MTDYNDSEVLRKHIEELRKQMKELTSALESIAKYQGPVWDGLKARNFQEIAKEALARVVIQ